MVQHESLGMLKEMLFALDLALHVGTPADRKAADRLQRRHSLLHITASFNHMPMHLSIDATTCCLA